MFSIIWRTENSLCKIAAKLYIVGRWTLYHYSNYEVYEQLQIKTTNAMTAAMNIHKLTEKNLARLDIFS